MLVLLSHSNLSAGFNADRPIADIFSTFSMDLVWTLVYQEERVGGGV